MGIRSRKRRRCTECRQSFISFGSNYCSDECRRAATKRRSIISASVMNGTFGGPYRVIYDPCDSFGYDSSFSRHEIDDMLELEYLAIGTEFEYQTGKRFIVCDNGRGQLILIRKDRMGLAA